MNGAAWAYVAYGMTALGALAVYFALPRGENNHRAAALVAGAAAIGALLLALHGGAGDAARPTLTFVVLSVLTVFAGARVITHRKPVYSALYFVLVVFATAGLAISAGAQFLAAALVIVYAGAILVTYVFVIMLAQQSPDADGARPIGDYDLRSREPVTAVLAGFLLVATLTGLIVTRRWPAAAPPSAANSLALGEVLLTRYAVAVEVAGVLLMVAMIGALVIARRHVPSEAPGPIEPPLPPGEAGRRVEPF